jgi:prevent-host-death family protein
MSTLPLIVPASDLRHKLSEVLQKVKKSPVVLTWRGRPRAVLIDYDAYSEITIRQAALEEARDAFLLLRAKETATEYLPFEALVRQYEELFGEKLELPVEG